MSATTTQLLSSGEFCKLRYDTLPVKSLSASISFYNNNSKMPNFALWHSCCKWAIWILIFQVSSACQAIYTFAVRVSKYYLPQKYAILVKVNIWNFAASALWWRIRFLWDVALGQSPQWRIPENRYALPCRATSSYLTV